MEDVIMDVADLNSDDEWVRDALGFVDLAGMDSLDTWTHRDALEEIQRAMEDAGDEDPLDTLRAVLALAYAGVREGQPESAAPADSSESQP